MKARLFLAIGVAMAVLPTGVDAAWEHGVDEYGLRTARADGGADFGSVHVPAALVLKCHPASDGAISWELELDEAKLLADFGLEDFEGPDAIAGSKVLNEIAPEGGMLRTTIRAAAAGFFSADGPDTFVLAVSAPSHAASDPALLADLVGPQTSALVWSVASLKAPGAKLVARFDGKGAAAALRETMMGCGPDPAFDAAELETYLDRTPAESGLWKLRPLEWRLKSVLGRDYAAFAKRMRNAGPLQREGEVWYVLAAPSKQDAAVVMFTPAGNLEVVRANAEDVKRHRHGSVAIDAPDAVREAIGASR